MTIDVLDRLSVTNLLRAYFSPKTHPSHLLSQQGHLNPRHQIHYFNWGRQAIYWLIKTAAWPKVVVPDFTCPVVVDAIVAAGAKPIFIKTNPHTLLIDLDQIHSVKFAPALIAVHTHGLIEDIPALKKLLPSTHIIEDCATALFSRSNSSLVGKLGHSVLFSLYKQVNGLNGAILTTSLKFERFGQPEHPLTQWKRLILRTQGPWQTYLNYLRSRGKHQLKKFVFQSNLSASDLARNLFSHNFEQAMQSAQDTKALIPLYHQHTQTINGINPIYIDPKTNPNLYRYPVLVEKNRDIVLLKLRSQGIFVDALWDDAYGDSEISRQILTLPIKPGYNQTIINKLFTSLGQALKI